MDIACGDWEPASCPEGRKCPPGGQCAANQDVCIMTSCGNGITEPLKGESCDDGNIIAGDSCSRYCWGESCGNGIIDVGETCEERTSDPEGACGADCLSDLCGNGIVNPGLGEKCDPPGPSPDPAVKDCNNYCVFVECGNRFVDSGEQCDDGNIEPGDGCSEQCLSEYCGNGIIDNDLGEQCDHGGSPGDRCSAICFIEVCGNGNVDSDEECDDNNTTAGDGCSSSCKSEACGNGLLEGSEVCDDGNAEPGDGCSSICTSESCGNNVTDRDMGEECDDGLPSAGDGCSEVCRYEECGNGIVDVQETCDDHNTSNGDGCSELCRSELCGNGVVDKQFGEACDDGNTQPGDACSEFCRTETCGNYVLNAGETCDDGNTDSGDGCSADCRSPKIDLSSRIGQKWQSLGGGPGDATSEVQEAPNGSAQYQSFTNGVIIDTGAPQAVYLTHALFSHWLALAGQTAHTGENLFVLVGVPVADFSAQPSHQSARFQRGMIITESGQPVRLVYGAIYQRYQGSDGVLGLPRSEVSASGPDGRFQQFEFGEIHWHANLGAFWLRGAILDRWKALGGAWGALGFPMSEPTPITVSGQIRGESQRFSTGAIYDTEYGAVAVPGDINSTYEQRGGPAGQFGLPTHAGSTADGDRFIDFTNGVMVHHNTNGIIYEFRSLEFAFEYFYTYRNSDGGNAPEVYAIVTVTWSHEAPLQVEEPSSGHHGRGTDICLESISTRARSDLSIMVRIELYDDDGGFRGGDDLVAIFIKEYSIDNLWGQLDWPIHWDNLNLSCAIFTIRGQEECTANSQAECPRPATQGAFQLVTP
jgi:cysteine-rich repeat protein